MRQGNLPRANVNEEEDQGIGRILFFSFDSKRSSKPSFARSANTHNLHIYIRVLDRNIEEQRNIYFKRKEKKEKKLKKESHRASN